eukprot:GHVU01120216.1.p1 GENE.GHVU01120216.1~~GHVU01120216.1.p1  ORF type:complete len:229 (-),score=38.79 GHVU01120216.1:694-1341(-)
MTQPKPCKVWDASRKLKKSVVAASLEELISKGAEKLGLDAAAGVSVVLEEDDTEVDDDDYFQLMPGNMTYLLLGPETPGQSWSDEDTADADTADAPFIRKEELQAVCSDELDSSQPPSPDETSETLQNVLSALSADMSQVIACSSVELQLIVDAEHSVVRKMLKVSDNEATRLQDACQRYLDDKQQAMDAIKLLNLYHNQKKNQRGTAKRPRMDT